MRFVETSVFTRQVTRLLSDDRYRSLQLALLLRPEQSPMVRGTGGLTYAKSDQEDLSPQQLRTLSRVIREELT